MRVFIACFLSEASARLLSGHIPEVAGMRRVPEENLHVTLLFAGSVTPEHLPAFQDMAAGLPQKEIAVGIREVTGFPRPGQARVLAARLEEDADLSRWHEQLLALMPSDAADSFDPHVTLGRFRTPRAVPDLSELAGLSLELRPPAAYRSDTLPTGARYSALAQYPG